MKTLVKKDIHLMGWNNLLIIIFGVFFGFLSVLNDEVDITQAGSLLAGLILIYIPLNSLIREESRTKDNILKSLPIDGRDIVMSRYITMFIYIIYVFGITFISSHIFSFTSDIPIVYKPVPLSGVLYNIILIMIFISIILPVQYLKRRISAILNNVLYLSLGLVPLIISKTTNNINLAKVFKDIGNLRFRINPFKYTLLGIGIYFISFEISTKIYKYIDR